MITYWYQILMAIGTLYMSIYREVTVFPEFYPLPGLWYMAQLSYHPFFQQPPLFDEPL